MATLCEALWAASLQPSKKTRAAVQRTGCSWTGLTVSKQQLEEGVARVKAAGLADSIRLLFCDYREGQALGQFDKVRSPCWHAHPGQRSALIAIVDECSLRFGGKCAGSVLTWLYLDVDGLEVDHVRRW